MPTILAREEQVNSLKLNENQTQTFNKHGLVIAPRVQWKHWQLGGEYIKYVLIKNTQLKVQKITYEIPESKFFTTLFPKPIILNAGNSYSLPITFHPIEKRVYRDVLKCHTNYGDFDVALLASLPLIQVAFPRSLVMPRCTLYGSIEKKFHVKNTGEETIPIKWLYSDPFEIKPDECVIDPGKLSSFRIVFRPKYAKFYEGTVVCQYGSQEIKYKKMRIIAQGKYPHLLVYVSGSVDQKEECVNGMKTSVCFEDVAVGFTHRKIITLKNLSLVEVPFKIEYPLRSTNKIDLVFDFPIKNGLIPPLSSVEMPILFTPSIVDDVYVEYFNVLPIGAMTKNIIKCIGNGVGPKISLEPSHVDFKVIDIGKEAADSIELVNMTHVPANYQFLIDTGASCFTFSSLHGCVKPHSSLKVWIKFKPPFPMNYHRRVTCLIHDQDPLFLDLLGTCHSEMVKPAVFRLDHIRTHEIRCNQGFSALPPDQLNELLENGAMKLARDGRIVVPQTPFSNVENTPSNAMAAYFASNPSTEECIGHVSDPPVTLEITRADFGRCTTLRTTVEKEFCVTNNTRGKVCVQWITGNQKIFTVHPSFMEIASSKAGTFKVFFNPDVPNQLYGIELECYIYYKCMQCYHLLPDETLCPPWCFPLACTGHTFSLEKETFLPRHVILDKTDLNFPSIALHGVAYKTFMISNTGKTPLFYEFDDDPSGTFSIKPNCGLIRNGHQIIVARFSPGATQLFDQTLNVTFNYTLKSMRAVKLTGPCEEPEIMLENGGEIYFKQTCIGASSTSQYSFKNLTKKALNFEWKIKQPDDTEIAIFPSSGQILANDSLNHQCLFSPTHIGKKMFKLKLLIWSEDSTEKHHQFHVCATATATTGKITVDPNYYNFGDVVVGRLSQNDIVLCNTGTCNLVCKLFVKQTANGEELLFSEYAAIHLSEWEVDMPAKSRKLVRATVRPSFQASYRFEVSYQLMLDQEQVKDPSLLEPKHLCDLLMNGVFPSLIITDIRGQGCANEISKRQLWSYFSLDTLNSYFSSDPAYQELMYSMETQKTTERLPSFHTQAIVELNFSAAPLHSPPSIFILQIENNGTVPAEWAFLFPDDMKLEVEPWADTGDLNNEELHQMKVLENKLFSVEPRNGYLLPGEGIAVTMTYNHLLAGTDRLNVLLKVVNGREILLNFVGVTVEPERPYIHFHSTKHTFLPMPVGQIYHPKQIYELYNGGAQSINYRVDTMPLLQLEKQNYNHSIFECLNPCGSLAPGKSAFIEWKFSPIECMTYSVDVPIHIEGGETALITFIGIGYDTEAMGQTMPTLDTSLCMNIPDAQAVPVPGQIVGLSRERISLGNIPLFAMKRSLVFVNNWSHNRQVTFNWRFPSSDDNHILSVDPVQGLLQPRESKLCKLSFIDWGLPGFYDIDLLCEITDETEVAKYKEEFRFWENERDRQKVEFTITEKHPHVTTPDMHEDMLAVSPERMFPFPSISKEGSHAEEQLVGYKTLPPIRQNMVSKQLDNPRGTRKTAKKKYWKKPQPPASFILHLGIMARTFDVKEFEQWHPEEYRYYFLDKTFGKNARLNSKGEKQTENGQEIQTGMIILSELHLDMLLGIMLKIIRGLLVDTYFHDALRDFQYEKIPYYQQIIPETPDQMDVPESKYKLISNQCHSAGSATRIHTNDSPSGLDSPLYRSLSVPATSREDDMEMNRRWTFLAGDQIIKDVDQNMTTKKEGEEVECTEMEEVAKLQEKENVKHLDEFSTFVDSFMGSCLTGIMQEALEREFNITAPSRFIALPKKPPAAPGSVSGAGPRIK